MHNREYKRFHLSSSDKRIAGVCGGLAEYFDIDPTLVRIIFLILLLGGGGGGLAYLIIWLVAPSY